MHRFLAIVTALVLGAASPFTAASTRAQSKGEIVIGLQCDRTGATQIVGTVLCPGFHDYVALVNSKGGVEGTSSRPSRSTTSTRCRRPSSPTSATRRKAR